MIFFNFFAKYIFLPHKYQNFHFLHYFFEIFEKIYLICSANNLITKLPITYIWMHFETLKIHDHRFGNRFEILNKFYHARMEYLHTFILKLNDN